MNSTIIYEQPLNERVRTFLRMEYLFNQVEHFIDNPGEWENRQTLMLMLEIVDFLTRSDLKSELIKELERHATTLVSLEGTPGVDNNRLQSVLEEINSYLMNIRDPGFQPGQTLRQDEFITSIKQRISIPGGTCNFDLPSYYFWLHKPEQERKLQMERWYSDLLVINMSIKLCLQMIRNSTNPCTKQAENGFYQQIMESHTACKLIRILLPLDAGFFPEISGGKHRITVRFLEQSSTQTRPVQSKNNIDFELHCCIL